MSISFLISFLCFDLCNSFSRPFLVLFPGLLAPSFLKWSDTLSLYLGSWLLLLSATVSLCWYVLLDIGRAFGSWVSRQLSTWSPTSLGSLRKRGVSRLRSSFLKSGYLSLVLGVESLGWWGGVKATIKLPPLPFLEVCSVITLFWLFLLNHQFLRIWLVLCLALATLCSLVLVFLSLFHPLFPV